MFVKRRQHTLKKKISFSGIGIHTGAVVDITFCPAEVDTGIVFERVDLKDKPQIEALVQNVLDTARSTTIGKGSVRIHTVEHVLAALSAYEIDNLRIEINNIEPPVGNGSSDVFVEMIEEAGVVEQEGEKEIFVVEQPIFYQEGDITLVGLPCPTFKISYTLSYPYPPVLAAQFFSLDVSAKSFKAELAPCRTFSLYKEIEMLMDRGLIKGGSLANAVVIQEEAIVSKGGLFFPNEMVRHKILDMVGDLSLVGMPIQAHILSIRSGHATNFAFSKKIAEQISLKR